jgi:small conductance mechanosensitive channel
MDEITTKIGEFLALYGIRIIAAIIIFVVGRWVAKILAKITERALKRSEVDEMLISFTRHMVYVILMIVVIMAALGKLGIQVTSLIAIIGAAGLAIGLALQGSLSNFAAGVLILIFHPFKAGDYVAGGGESGTVEKVQIFTTQLKTVDNKTIIIPNSKIMGDTITNFSVKEIRRIDFVFGVSYGDNIDKVKNVIDEVLSKDERILEDPPATIGLLELADSSVNFAVRPWVKTGDYWNVFFDIMEAMKKRFDDEEISIPFPQRDVHLFEYKD